MKDYGDVCCECWRFHATSDLVGICKKTMETCFYTDKCHLLVAAEKEKTNKANTFIKKEG